MSGHRKPAYSRHRVDSTAKALTAEAKRLGVGVVELGGTIDAAFYLGRSVWLVDFKSPNGQLEPSQAKLVAQGVPLYFISSVEQLTAFVAHLKREVLR